jgi:NADPH:quinone reductase-like Zn-dependent oxidoreductase
MMTAIVQEHYGDDPEDVLRVEQVARPTIGDDQVLVRVHAASVDRGTWHVMAGVPYPIRVAGFGLRRPKYANPGRSLAGRVERVGRDVTELQAGDEVFGVGHSTFAEYAAAPAAKLAMKPTNLSFKAAAAVPISGLTALQAVRDRGKVTSGQRVLITGAAGGVGTFAVQLAKAHGAEVTGVGRTDKLDAIRALGADHVVDYTRQDPLASGQRYDVILDIAGNRRLSELRRALTSAGTLVITGGETDGRWVGGTDRQLRAQLLSLFVSQQLRTFISSENGADLATLRTFIESGQVTPLIDGAYPLEATARAVRRLLDGDVTGKVVITVGDER